MRTSTSQNEGLTRLDDLAALARGLRVEYDSLSLGAKERRARLYVALTARRRDDERID